MVKDLGSEKKPLHLLVTLFLFIFFYSIAFPRLVTFFFFNKTRVENN